MSFGPASDKERELAPRIRRLDRALSTVTPADFEDWARDLVGPALDAARGWLDGWLDAWDWRGVVDREWGNSLIEVKGRKWREKFLLPMLAAARSCQETCSRIVELRKWVFDEGVEAADAPASVADVQRLVIAMEKAPLYGRATPVLQPNDRRDLEEFALFFRNPLRGWPPRRPATPESAPPKPATTPPPPATPPASVTKSSEARKPVRAAEASVLGLLRSKQPKTTLLIRLVELIESKGQATHDEIARFVWGDHDGKGGKEDPGWQAISRLKDRANEFFDEHEIPLMYRCEAACVIRVEDPE